MNEKTARQKIQKIVREYVQSHSLPSHVNSNFVDEELDRIAGMKDFSVFASEIKVFMACAVCHCSTYSVQRDLEANRQIDILLECVEKKRGKTSDVEQRA